MDKDKHLMLLQGEQALVRVGVQMGLVNKVLGEDEGLFLKQKMVLAQYYDEIECHGLILIQPNIYIKQKQVEVAILAFLKINFWYYLSKIMIMFRDKNNFCKEFDDDISDLIAQNNLNYEYPRSFYKGRGGGSGLVTQEYDSEIIAKNETYIWCSPPIMDKFNDKILKNINNKIAGEFLMTFAETSIGEILGIKIVH